MAYIPVSERNKKPTSGYIPVSARQSAPPAASAPLPPKQLYKLEDGRVVNKQQLSSEINLNLSQPPKFSVIGELGNMVDKVANTATSAGQGFIRGGFSIGSSLINPLLPKKEQMKEFTPTGPVATGLLGEEAIPTIETHVDIAMQKQREKIQKNDKQISGFEQNLYKYGVLPVAGLIGGGMPALDLTLGGGEKKVITALMKVGKAEDAATILRKMGVADDLVADYASVFVKTKTATEVEKGLAALNNAVETTRPSRYVPVASRGAVGKTGQTSTQLAETLPSPTRHQAQSQTQPRLVQDKSYTGTIETPKPPVKVYRAQEVGTVSTGKGFTFFTDSPTRAKEYGDVIKNPYGQVKVTSRDVNPDNFFVSTKKNYLTDVDSPSIKANYEGIKFKDGDSWSFAAFDKKPQYVKASDGKFAGSKTGSGFKNAPENALTVGDDMYAANRARPPQGGVSKSFSNMAGQIKSSAGKVLSPISTRLKNINPVLKKQLRQYEFNSSQARNKDLKSVEGWLSKTKKMAQDDWSDLDLALKNSDQTKVNQIVSKYNLQAEYGKVRKVLDEVYDRTIKVGYETGYTEGYHPRKIADPKGYLEFLEKGDDWGLIDRAIQKREAKLGRQLSLEERAYVANSMVRGYPTGQISLSTPGALKSRGNDLVTADTNAFYKDSNSALVDYLVDVNDAVEGRNFFGKGPKGKPLDNVDDSIGAYVDQLIRDGLIKRSQEEEIKEMLFARFNPGRMNGVLANLKNTSYIDVMGSFTSAITQIQDFGFSLAKNGVWNTIKSVMSTKNITLDDLGLAKHIALFEDASTLSKAVDTVFTLTGLNKLDRLAKETYVNAAWSKVQGEAKNPSLAFLKKMDSMFGSESDDVIKTIQTGEIDDNVRLMMFNELLDVAPVALSEMPEAYLKAGNGKILYMLKSYTIKQLDVYKNDVIDLAKTDPKQAAVNFTKLTAALLAMGVAADEIKEFVLDKEDTDLSDKVINNTFKFMGFNRYTVDNLGRNGISGALKDMLFPPMRAADNVYKDIKGGRGLNEGQTVRSVPVVGELYYWWMGNGSDPEEEDSDFGLPELPELPGLPELPELPELPSL